MSGTWTACRTVAADVSGKCLRHVRTCCTRGGQSGDADRTPAQGVRSPRTSACQQDQPVRMCRTPAVRTAVVPEAADGQSADRSDSLQLPLLFLKAAGGRLRRPSSAGNDTTAIGEPGLTLKTGHPRALGHIPLSSRLSRARDLVAPYSAVPCAPSRRPAAAAPL
jgi:hypothetical protein